MDKLIELTKKIYTRAGFGTHNVSDEDMFVSNSLRPFVFLDMGYEMFKDVDSSKFTFERKKLYNQEDKKWKAAFEVFHKGMTDEEKFLLSDYEDRMNEHLSHYRDLVVWAAESNMMDIPAEVRHELAKLFTAETICVACCYFIDYGMKLGVQNTGKFKPSKYGTSFCLIRREKNDFHIMCEHLYMASVFSEKLTKEIRRNALNSRTADNANFGECEQFKNALDALFNQYLTVSAEGIGD